MRWVGEHAELSNLAVFLLADGCGYITGEVIAIDGGQCLNTAGNFAHLAALTDEDWTQIRDRIRSANEKDRGQRSV